ncbi:EscU/YscU/HrcU family type III secretion system export apparatus switch protein [Caulobacter sp. DWR1-3-2b1]|uniref:EscU/YscU/HrcU family type III secretion system export apparatus switch protein n=1 Tax=Caulobacter sp. DWR1-3-2b1 TaxID=2804670 RepID=UPI003CEDAA90
MSQEGGEQNPSEAPTPFKLQKARERGSLARGTDLAFFAGIGTFLLYAWMQGDELMAALARASRAALVAAPQIMASERGLFEICGALFQAAARPLTMMLLVIFLVVLVFELAQNRGLIFTAAPLKPDFSRLNPATGFKKIFSVRMLIETAKSLLKLGVYGGLAGLAIVAAMAQAPLTISNAEQLADGLSSATLKLVAMFVLAALAFAIFDQLIARRDFFKKMRMSRREVKREHRDREGDARLKQKRKELHNDFAKSSQSLRGLKGADVLIANPTHFAVALRYRPAQMEAPVIVSRGSNRFALRLKRLAFIHGVVVVESPVLARALFRFDVDSPVPDALFAPVAEIYRSLSDRGALRRMNADA